MGVKSALASVSIGSPVPNGAVPQQRPIEAVTPFAGFAVDERGAVTGRAVSGPHLLLLAGSGAGKSRRVLVPQIVTWEGPVCAVSAKGDLAEMSGIHRARRGGPMYLMDLTGEVDAASLPEGVVRVANDPCALLLADAEGNTDDSALDLANLLLQVGSLGMGGSGSGGGDSAFWMTLAVRSLAALIQAGAWYPDPKSGELVWGGGIDWVLRAAIRYGDIGASESGDEDVDLDLTGADWDVAAIRATLAGVEPRRRLGRH